MSKIDQFESAFKSAERNPFKLERVEFNNCLTVTDQDTAEADELTSQLQSFLQHVTHADSNWQALTRSDLRSVESFLKEIEKKKPDLICTYRNLMAPASEYPYSLGVFLDVMCKPRRFPCWSCPAL